MCLYIQHLLRVAKNESSGCMQMSRFEWLDVNTVHSSIILHLCSFEDQNLRKLHTALVNLKSKKKKKVLLSYVSETLLHII